ncbi:MAG: UDP-N-acetylmuramate dehydrogenase [Gemmataceae bacterium]
MAGLDSFAEIVQTNVPLAPFTHLKLGGPAEYLAQPRSREELAAVVGQCFADRLPLRVLGSGCNLLIRDEGVKGLVLRLNDPFFAKVEVHSKEVTAGAGAAVSALISESVRHGLGGLEMLVGIKGTVGGALRCNAGDRGGDIGQFVRRVEVLDVRGKVQVREREELRFVPHKSNLDDPVLLTATFGLETDDPGILVKRMRRAWIHRKAHQPLSFQAANRIFQDPPGFTAGALIDQAGLARTHVGGAEVSDRDPNAIVVHPGGTARDVLRLIDLIGSRVREQFKVELTLEITIW